MFMPPRCIGQIVPSSNHAVERTTEALLAGFPGWGACYARIPYRPDGTGQPAGGYDVEGFRTAAALLADAGVAALSWNGTKGAMDGFEVDRALCGEMAKVAGCPVTTVSLDVLTILGRLGAGRIALVTPGAPDRGALIAAEFTARGHAVVALRAFDHATNHAAAQMPEAELDAAIRSVHAEAPADAVLVWSTNFAPLPLITRLEADLGVSVIDSTSIGLWGCFAALGIGTGAAARFGRIFSLG